MALTHSSVIVTASAVDTRARDATTFPFTARPQAMSVYSRFVDLGTSIMTGSASLRVWQIGNTADTGARILLYHPNGTTVWRALMPNGIGSTQVLSDVTVSNSVGDSLEALVTLSATGVIQLTIAINGGTPTTGTASGTITMPTEWGAATLMVGHRGSNLGHGFNAFRNIEIVSGVRTMQQMRVLAGTD